MYKLYQVEQLNLVKEIWDSCDQPSRIPEEKLLIMENEFQKQFNKREGARKNSFKEIKLDYNRADLQYGKGNEGCSDE